MTHLLLALALALPASAEVLLVRDGDRLCLTGGATLANLRAPAALDWERPNGASTVECVQAGDTLTITARLDLCGPDWAYISVVSDECGIAFNVRNMRGDTSAEVADCVEALSLDARTIVNAIVAHLGQSGIPDIRVMRAHPTDAAKGRAMEIVSRLDADVFTERELASRELAGDVGAMAWVVAHEAELKDLSPEQLTRIGAAVAPYRN